jgi:hypothetical protein
MLYFVCQKKKKSFKAQVITFKNMNPWLKPSRSTSSYRICWVRKRNLLNCGCFAISWAFLKMLIKMEQINQTIDEGSKYVGMLDGVVLWFVQLTKTNVSMSRLYSYDFPSQEYLPTRSVGQQYDLHFEVSGSNPVPRCLCYGDRGSLCVSESKIWVSSHIDIYSNAPKKVKEKIIMLEVGYFRRYHLYNIIY